ncbi:MAG TPA: hypothetical protein VMH04_22285 [Candidatus Solibacter sp.]|nr:hypothetical protein [Candidatus Solibacter sp.]
MKPHRSLVRWLVLGILIFSLSAASFAQVFVSVRFGPPALPVYAQPICPGPGYFWTPGYWGWNDDGGYYWVPGTWVVAPVGLLWTPGYWGWGGGFYAWHPGYWGPHVGFYGGINYGFGYTGVGFFGGEWRGGAFFYNRAVANVSVTNVTHVYNRTVIVNENHTAFNGGEGGIAARPTAQEEAYSHEQHREPLESQAQHERIASQNHENFASANHGRPAVAATARAGDFSSHSAISARSAGGEYHAPTISPKEARGPSNGGGNRGFNPPNSNRNEGRAGGNEKSNDGFRPFTPPSKGDTENGARGNEGRGNEARGNESRGNEGRNNEVRSEPHTPPSSSHSNTESHGSKQNQHKSSPPPKKENNREPKRH